MSGAEHPDVIDAFKRAGRGAPRRDRKALFAAGDVESGLRDLPYGDRDSSGALQQRPSQGWGPAGEGPEKDARQFLKAARRLCKPGMSSAECAQAVQRSGFPGRYADPSVQRRAQRLSAGGNGPSTDTGTPLNGATQSHTIPGQSFQAERDAAKRQLLLGGGHLTMDKLLSYKQTVNSLQDVPARITRTPGRQSSRPGVSNIPAKRAPARIKITGAQPDRLKPAVVSFMRRLSQVTGEPITGDSGAGHSRLTVNGNVSQHTTGDAVDIPAVGERLIRLGQEALILAGMPPAKARKQRGGLYNVGGRQIIFNTHEGGDHTDHLHFGD